MCLRNSNRRQRGFTLVELLIVVVVLAILMAVALPLYLDAITKAEVRVCRANMQSLSNAEQAYRSRNPGNLFATDLTLLEGDLGSVPTCPRFGAYSAEVSDGTAVANNGMAVPAGGIVLKCSAAGHGVFAPSIDSD